MKSIFFKFFNIIISITVLFCFCLTVCGRTLTEKDMDFYELAKLSEKDDVKYSIKNSSTQGNSTVYKNNYLVDVIVEIPNNKTLHT